MPRLTGKQPHIATKGAIVIVVLAVIAIVLELLGVIDVVPRVGNTSQSAREDTSLVGGNYV